MTEIQRAQMRGRPLLPMCYNAQISRHEYRIGEYDFSGCYGMFDMMTENPTDECRECGAFVEGDFIGRAKEIVK